MSLFLKDPVDAVPVRNIHDLFNYDLWRQFLAGDDLAKSSVKNKEKKLNYASQHGRVLAMYRFFAMFERRSDLLSPTQIENGSKIRKLLETPCPFSTKAE